MPGAFSSSMLPKPELIFRQSECRVGPFCRLA